MIEVTSRHTECTHFNLEYSRMPAVLLQLFHLTCVANLSHNWAIKVKSYFQNVDQLIAKLKSATVKSKTRQATFATIGCPPPPVVIKWGSWLNGALYYAKNLPEAKIIVESFERSAILVSQAKVSLQTTGLITTPQN